METQKILKRSEVPAAFTWDLTDIFPDDAAWTKEYEALKDAPAQIEAFRGTLGRSAADLLGWFRMDDGLSLRLTKLYGYANCKSDEDTGNGFYQDLRAKAVSTYVAIGSAAAFVTPAVLPPAVTSNATL